MSRVAKKQISLPKGVEVSVDASGTTTVKGPKGALTTHALPGVSLQQENGIVNIVVAEGADDKFGGTARALIANMVTGVSQGFERKLELVGVGYRAALAGKTLNLSLGYSHPVVFDAPEGITIEVPTQTEVLVKGADKQLVGQVAAKIRGYRKPEPYKGKGVRYSGEKILLKEAKKA
ncbi:LSU ribosomal protein L6P [Luteibacter rhizovicinus]|uniref:Large ribosomal subunit protein uL6 n=1 Tax=Luteibacter rhizovicinus TaxID=242606 RepID=A0A4R3YI00_9GAMM|nr:50S ribosomal protein L6 [Luteibacter rhizovicinus]TCV91800.1 LSU ribosomal protein L6P [Luteibacter rhizovicinus]